MKLPAAIGLGAIAGLAIPYAVPGSAGWLGAMVHNVSRTVHLAGFDIRFSLAIFLVVALFSWAFMAWSDS